MRFINRGRGTGKTAMFIDTAYVMDIPIIVSTETQKKHVLDQAEKMNCNIKCFTIYDFMVHDLHRTYKKILLDECKQIIDDALNNYLKCEVISGSMSIPMKPDDFKFDKNEFRRYINESYYSN